MFILSVRGISRDTASGYRQECCSAYCDVFSITYGLPAVLPRYAAEIFQSKQPKKHCNSESIFVLRSLQLRRGQLSIALIYQDCLCTRLEPSALQLYSPKHYCEVNRTELCCGQCVWLYVWWNVHSFVSLLFCLD